MAKAMLAVAILGMLHVGGAGDATRRFFVEKHGDVSVSVFVGLPGLRCWTKGPKAEFWIHYCGGKRGWTLGVMAFHCGAVLRVSCYLRV